MTPLAQIILSSLLGKGYFPNELPPAFTTADFGKHAADILTEWEAAKLFAIKKAKEFPKVDGKCLRARYGYTIRGLKKPLNSSRIVEYAENCPSSAIRLLLLDMKDKGICLSKLPLATWESEVSEERVLTDWSWLYAYEAIRKGWIKDHKNVLSSPFFKAMDQRDVVFYDPKKNVKNSEAVKKTQLTIRKQQNLKVIKFLNMLRGIRPSEEVDWSEY